MFYISLAILILGALAAFLAKKAMKRRMGDALGREVGDHELNSIGSWMKVEEKESEKRDGRQS